MQLRRFLAAVAHRWVTVLALTLGGLAVAAGISLLQTPQYTSQTSVFFSIQFGGSASELAQGATYTQNSVTSYATLAVEPIVLDPVIQELELDLTAAALADRVAAAAEVDTSIVEVAVTDPSPTRAAAIAAAIAQQLTETVDRLSPQDSDEESTVEAAIVAPAVVPTSATSPNIPINIGAGVLVGLLLGLGGAFLREIADTRVRVAADVPAITQAPVLGTVGEFPKGSRGLVVADFPSGLHAEAFRQIRTNLQFLGVKEHARSIVITSALPAEGKSAVAANLAIALSETSSRVLLIDADLRRPSMAALMGMEGAAGLTTVLIGRAEFGDVVQEWGAGDLHVLPSGQIPPNPSELLDSPAMTQLLEFLEQRYDYVILDTAPLLPVTDAAILSRLAMGTIVVANARRVRRHQLADALGFLGQVEGRVLGVVLNAANKTGEEYGYTPLPTGTGTAGRAVASVASSTAAPEVGAAETQAATEDRDHSRDDVPVRARGQAAQAPQAPRATSATKARRTISGPGLKNGVAAVRGRRRVRSQGRGDAADERGLAGKEVPGSTAAPRSRPRP